MNKPMKILMRLVISNVAIAFCIGLASLFPGLWTGVGGRDFRPQAFNAAIFVLATSVVMRYALKWPVLHMMVSLIPIQFIVLISMSYFSGYAIFQIFNSFDLFHDFLQWLLLVDFFIGTPWILGIFVGSLMLKVKNT